MIIICKNSKIDTTFESASRIEFAIDFTYIHSINRYKISNYMILVDYDFY